MASEVIPEPIRVCIEDFKRLALQIGPKFKYLEAQSAKIWGSHRSITLGYNFNAIKEMAGLVVNKKRGSSDTPIRSPRNYTSEPRHYKPKEKGPAAKACLGYIEDRDCKRKVPKGEYFCPRCKVKNSLL